MARSGYHYRTADQQYGIACAMANFTEIAAESIRPVEPRLFGETCGCGLNREFFKTRREFNLHKETCSPRPAGG